MHPHKKSTPVHLDTLQNGRRWRSSLLWTLRDLRRSTRHCRPLSLPNLNRLFNHRWYATNPAPGVADQGLILGQSFLRQYYLAHQPFQSQNSSSRP
jgi:hypothetical protein